MKSVPKCLPYDRCDIHWSTQLHNPRRGDNSERVIGGPHGDPCIHARVFRLPADQGCSDSDHQSERAPVAERRKQLRR
jgi:hypothetical protein